MRLPVVALVALAAAVVGGAVAAVVVIETDVGPETSTVVVQSGTGGTVAPLPVGTGTGFDAAAIYKARSPGVVTLYADLGPDGSTQGSGFVVDAKGHILTNAHVVTNVAEAADRTAVHGADEIYVEFKDGERVSARIVGWDLFSDVAVVEVDPADHPLLPVPLGRSAGVAVGTPVAAIGSPFGKQSSLTVGVVSATGRTIDSLTSEYAVANAIQIDAAINHGNSGGPLFDPAGRVIGINAQIESASGEAEGVGFAIPIDVARRSLEQLLRDGKVRYAYLGVVTQDVTPSIAKRFGFGAQRGALVVQVTPGTPAARAGLVGGTRTMTVNGQRITVGGDLVVAIDGKTIRGTDDVSRLVTMDLLPGQTVPITILRGGTRRETVNLKLESRPLTP